MATKEVTKTDAKTWGDKLDDKLRAAENRARREPDRHQGPGAEVGERQDGPERPDGERDDGLPAQDAPLVVGEILPGGKTGKHRHTSEAIMLALSGQGYSVIDGKRYEWSEGDAIVMPAMTWHQHFNASDSKPFQVLCRDQLSAHREHRAGHDRSGGARQPPQRGLGPPAKRRRAGCEGAAVIRIEHLTKRYATGDRSGGGRPVAEHSGGVVLHAARAERVREDQHAPLHCGSRAARRGRDRDP